MQKIKFKKKFKKDKFTLPSSYKRATKEPVAHYT